MNRVCLVIISCVFSLAWIKTSAQFEPDEVEPHNRTLALYVISPSFATSASSALNPVLLSNGFPKMPKGNLNWGLGGQYRLGKFILGIDVMASHQKRQRGDTGSNLVRTAITSNINFGFYIYQGTWFSLYPYTAISGTEASIYLSKQTPATTLNSILATPGNTVQMGHFSGGVIVGVGVDLHNLTKSNSVFESLKIGYRISPDSPYAWESPFTSFSDAPADKFNYLFIQLTLGTAWHWQSGRE